MEYRSRIRLRISLRTYGAIFGATHDPEGQILPRHVAVPLILLALVVAEVVLFIRIKRGFIAFWESALGGIVASLLMALLGFR
jgi:hypothetical protein